MEKEVKLAINKLIFRAFSNSEVLGKRKEKELSTVVDILILFQNMTSQCSSQSILSDVLRTNTELS